MGMVCSARVNYFPLHSEPICFLGEKDFQWLETAHKDIPHARQVLEASSALGIPTFDLKKSVDLENPAVLSEYLENQKHLPIALPCD